MNPEDVKKQLEARLAVYAASSGLKISVSLERQGSARSKFTVHVSDVKEAVVKTKLIGTNPVGVDPPIGTKIHIAGHVYELVYISKFSKLRYEFKKVNGFGKLRRMSSAAFDKYFRGKAF